jgi:uncharacterized protein (DUF433 family)
LEWGFAAPPAASHPYIARVPGILSGRPVIRGTRIAVWQVANSIVHLGESVADYHAGHAHLSLAQIYAALSYYFGHQDEIEVEIDSQQMEHSQKELSLTIAERSAIAFPKQNV